MKTILLATALVALAPAMLLAQDSTGGYGARGGHHGEDMFKRWDTNGDGVISRDEANAAGAERVAKMFDQLDKNQDGQLSQDELRQGHQDHMAAMKGRFDADFKNADKNGDGSLSKDEAAAMPMISRHFDEIDTNKDGEVSREEIGAHHAKMGGRFHHGDARPPQD